MNNMAVVNVNNLLNIKDSRWLQLEVCREFQRNKCSRPDTECKFAHPPANVEVQNGRVTACYDSIKGRCNREKPPCKYFHPPPHLKDQLLINGRNHLALKNALMQQMGLAPGQPVVPGQVPAVATNPYLGVTSQAYNPYFAAGPLVPLVSDPTGAVSPLGVPQQTVVQQKVQRADRLENFFRRLKYGLIGKNRYGTHHRRIRRTRSVTEIAKFEQAEDYSPPCSPEPQDLRSSFTTSFYGPKYKLTLQDKNRVIETLVTYPGMVAYKRPAGDKSGVPVYQPANTPSAAAYQQLMQLQQPFVPVSSTSLQHSNATMTTASSSNSMGGITSATQDHNSGGLANGSLDSHGNDAMKRMKAEDNDTGDLHDGSSSLNINNTGNDLDEEAKAESANKRMRVQNVGSGGQTNVSQVPNPMGQNNAAYVAAAQTYHNALAAMTYTGVALQTNKAQQQQASQSVPQAAHGYPGGHAAAAAAAAAAFQQQHQGFQSQQSQQQQQQNQQQQLLNQYQAMAAAAALANQGSFQGGGYGNPQANNTGNPQNQNPGMNLNMNAASAAGLNPFAAAAAMNPLLAASIPQFAAAQRAGLLANQQSGQQLSATAQFNPAALAAAGIPTAQSGANPGVAAFNPFGVQFAAGPAGGSSATGLPFQGNQQALLAAYGQFARAPVPVAAVSAAPTITSQQIYVGNPAAAAAAAAAAAGSGALQAGVKRLRPQ